MRYGSMQYSPADQAFVTEALGKPPHSVVGVAARNDAGQPAVIINLPLVRVGESWQPFPTLYWLVEPSLCTAVAGLEREGAIGEIEAAIAADDELMREHLADNKLYARSRWAVLTKQEKQAAEQHGLSETLQTTGIAGIAHHASVKCLHAQYAYHLARNEAGTAVGRLMDRQYAMRAKR